MSLRNIYVIILVVITVPINMIAQPAYQDAILDSSANFYAIQSDFYTWLNAQNQSDPIVISKLKKFNRFEEF